MKTSPQSVCISASNLNAVRLAPRCILTPPKSNPSETKLSTVEQKTSQCGRQDALTINFMTTRARERRDARRLVAMYSIEAPDRLADSPAQVLGTVLNRNAANSETRDIVSPWRKFFESLSADKPEP